MLVAMHLNPNHLMWSLLPKIKWIKWNPLHSLNQNLHESKEKSSTNKREKSSNESTANKEKEDVLDLPKGWIAVQLSKSYCWFLYWHFLPLLQTLSNILQETDMTRRTPLVLRQDSKEILASIMKGGVEKVRDGGKTASGLG